MTTTVIGPAPSVVLDRAIEVLDARGWTQGPEGWPGLPGEEDGRVCIEGALQAALGLDYMEIVGEKEREFHACEAYQAVVRELSITSEWTDAGGEPALWKWNDLVCGSVTEARKVLVRARDRCREEGR